MDDHLPPESVITFDRNAHACSLEKGRASAAEMPRERLLTETDVPFAHPEGTVKCALRFRRAEKDRTCALSRRR
jgi:Tat protein secretion system quality control protein TatD with DNase activity